MRLHPHRWVLFAVGFCVGHFAFWIFLLVRDIALSPRGGRDVDMGILGTVVIALFLGPLTGVMITIGYALIDSVVSVSRNQPSFWRYDSIVAGLMAAVALFIGMSLRETLPKLSNNLANSYLGGGRDFSLAWGPLVLGGLSGALTWVIGGFISKGVSGARSG